MFELAKYKNTYGIYCTKTKNFLVFGKKKDLIKRIKELNELEKQKPTRGLKIDFNVE